MTKRPFKFEVGVGFAHCNTFPQGGRVPRVPQITENELCQEHRKHKKTVLMITKKICLLLCFQSFLWAKNFALTKVSFIQRAFKYSKTYVENSRTFQGCPTIFNFQGVFKDMMLFQGLFTARANHANILIHAPI